jgi:hypothetical protein
VIAATRKVKQKENARQKKKRKYIGKIGGYTHPFSRQCFFIFIRQVVGSIFSTQEFSLIGRHPNLK